MLRDRALTRHQAQDGAAALAQLLVVRLRRERIAGLVMLEHFVGAIANGQTLTLTARSTAVIVRVPDYTVALSCT